MMAGVKTQPETVKRNPYLVKWSVLFDRVTSQWISFKPQEGLNVYPCYACRDMFGSKNSFLDHVNRRGILLTFRCSVCSPNDALLFYNPCSLLLHARSHYNFLGGQIDLDNLSISSLPLGLAGFLPHPDVPMLYDTGDDEIEHGNLNTRFYSPVRQDMGQKIVNLTPTVLLFCHLATTTALSVTLVLKQISSNIPLCKFVVLENHALSIINVNNSNEQSDNISNAITPDKINQKKESPDNGNSLLVIDDMVSPKSRNEEMEEEITGTEKSPGANELITNFNCCPECKKVQKTSMSMHFVNCNRPVNEALMCPVCKYIAPSQCSLQAHQRIHEGVSPYVCPECGRNFSDCESLLDHLDDVCFHLAKEVRYRCPQKNCCKVFAQIGTFHTHFTFHVQILTRCRICSMYFCDINDYFEHTKLLHNDAVATELIHRCTVCKNGGPPFTEDMLESHARLHCSDRAHCVYVYVCKYCRNFFRSTLTYATHLLRCSKKATSDESYKIKRSNRATICTKCNYIIRMVMTISHCPKCGKPFNTPYTIKHNTELENVSAKTSICLLCKKQFPVEEYLLHVKNNECKYYKPVVVLNRLSLNIKSNTAKHANDSAKSEEILKKKRKKHLATPTKKLQVYLPEPELLKLEEPTPFDGTYNCQLCSYVNESRADFHNHIIAHRNISTAYQCMECGECFVVKPSLQKHLLYYHQVFDFDAYIEENNCFDKGAVGKLQEIMKLGPGECEIPVAENQCRVCLQQFQDELELNKHFRIHGMAFLLKNIK